MSESDAIPHVKLAISEEDIQGGASRLLKHLRPTWQQNDVRFKLLTDGITNKLVKCTNGSEENDVVLVRVYGRKTDLLIDRTAETKNIILLHNENLAPALYGTFDNGLAYEFAPGVTLTTETVKIPNIFSLVAYKMAKLHLVQCKDASNEPMIWKKIDQFYNLVPETFTDPHVQKRFKKMNLTKEKISLEIKQMRDCLGKYNSPIVFCHNDLLLGNIVYDANLQKVTFIDYEYAGMNYQAYDIGNHFNEFAGVENIDYKNYPSKVLQLAWLYQYLRVYWDREDIKIAELEEMYVKVNKFGQLSHLMWGLWALIQAEHSTIDFDFIKFATDHFNRYFDVKEEFQQLGMSDRKDCKSKGCQL